MVRVAALVLGFVVAAAVMFAVVSAYAIERGLPPALAGVVVALPVVWHVVGERRRAARGRRAQAGTTVASRFVFRALVWVVVVFGPLLALDGSRVLGAVGRHGLWWWPSSEARPVEAAPVEVTQAEPEEPARETGIVGRTGPPRLADEDGRVVTLIPIELFGGETKPFKLPGDVSASARVGYIDLEKRRISCLFDPGGARPVVVLDENGNSDLGDDPRRIAGKRGLNLEVEVPGEHPLRLRVFGQEMAVQDTIVRRGELAVGDERVAFALIGMYARYDAGFNRVAIDLDRDGLLDLARDDGPETLFVSERTVTLGERSYEMVVEPAGDSLTLRPLAERLPPRATMLRGTAPPAFTTRAVDGATVQMPRERPTVLMFWSDACHFCVADLPKVHAFAAANPGVDVVLLAATDGAAARSLAPLANLVQVAGAGEIHALYRVHAVPEFFAVDGAGELLCARCGLSGVQAHLPAR